MLFFLENQQQCIAYPPPPFFFFSSPLFKAQMSFSYHLLSVHLTFVTFSAEPLNKFQPDLVQASFQMKNLFWFLQKDILAK